MSVQNLESLIKAKEKQMGINITEEDEEQKPEIDENEVMEVLKLIFEYMKQSIGNLNKEITNIKQQQEKILEELKKQSKE